MKILSCDVCVVGAGFAGIEAALAAAHKGANTIICSLGSCFSGSSFYPGTWGMGLVGPFDDAEGTDSLVDKIIEIGQGLALPALVRELVEHIRPAIQQLKDDGIQLKEPLSENRNQTAYIPCFDDTHRDWHGLLREPYQATRQEQLQKADVRCLEQLELMNIVPWDESFKQAQGAQQGFWRFSRDMKASMLKRQSQSCSHKPQKSSKFAGIFYDHKNQSFLRIDCSAFVLCTGGNEGLFARNLTGNDVISTTQALALELGAELINYECMQIMPGYNSPQGVVFNEKTFRYVELDSFENEGQKRDRSHTRDLLEMRSFHGPVSFAGADHKIDVHIAQHEPCPARFCLPEKLPEFVQSFWSWYKERFGVSPAMEFELVHYAHAANGGIFIDRSGSSNLQGIFAAGECTGGMHGADRMGGLASANSLVFGMKAGAAAADYALNECLEDSNGISSPHLNATELSEVDLNKAAESSASFTAVINKRHPHVLKAISADIARVHIQDLRCVLAQNCLVLRSEEAVKKARASIQEIRDDVEKHAKAVEQDLSDAFLSGQLAREIAAYRRLQLMLINAEALLCSISLRKESRGSHYRSDYPASNDKFAKPLVVKMDSSEKAVGHFLDADELRAWN